MTTQIGSSALNHCRVVPEQTDGSVAAFAQQAAQFAGLMAMVNIEMRSAATRFMRQAYGTLTALRSEHLSVVKRRDASFARQMTPSIHFWMAPVVLLNSQANPRGIAPVDFLAPLRQVFESGRALFTAPLLRSTSRSWNELVSARAKSHMVKV